MSSAGRLLAEYRKARRLSQLDLGLQAEVSARHISFFPVEPTAETRFFFHELADMVFDEAGTASAQPQNKGFIDTATADPCHIENLAITLLV